MTRRPEKFSADACDPLDVTCQSKTVNTSNGREATILPREWFGAAPLRPLDCLDASDRRVPWRWFAAAVVLVSLLLFVLPGRGQIPPLVGSDYCYQLVAADRMYNGLGPTAPLPVAPLQPWEWQADWVYLTQWPLGYPLLICAVRWLSGVTTIQACQWISLVACAVALVGWFGWVRRLVPHGITGTLLAAITAGCSVSTALFVNPSTDVLLIAFLPFVMLLTRQAIGDLERPGTDTRGTRPMLWLTLAGFMSGGLFWIRYAGIFVPVAVGFYLLVERYHRRIVGLRHIGVFAVCAALPIAALLAINTAFGATSSMQTQLNLGHAVGFDLSIGHLTAAWWNFTKFGFYDYHWYSRWVFALWPLVGLCAALVFPPARRVVRLLLKTPSVTLSLCLVLTWLIMLVGVTALFSEKYRYVDQIRYFLPIKPLYFVLFVTPLLLIPRRVARVGLCLALLLGCSWILQQEWQRPYKRWLTANRKVTPYGQWAHCFQPNAAELYRWLSHNKADNLIVISNFHDHITLETQIPALPIPPNAETLHTWINRIRQSRAVEDPRVLFVLDHDNRWRDYWIKPTAKIVEDFGLSKRTDGVSAAVSALVFDHTTQTGAR